MPEISVVIPTYNRLDMLARVIPTLLEQDLAPSEYELLVCDSRSTDGTAEYVAQVRDAHSNVRHLAGSYSGRAAARNAGIAAARGDIVVFNDADILASPNLLSTHLRRHRERRGIAVVGLEVQVNDFEEYLYKRDHPATRGHLHTPSRKRLSWLYFLTGNASVRREDLVRAGRFDEGFTGYGHEDLELGYRLQKMGIEIIYEPDAVNYHCQAVPYEDQKAKMRVSAGRDRPRYFIASIRLFRHAEPRYDADLARRALAAEFACPLLLGHIDRRAGVRVRARAFAAIPLRLWGLRKARSER